MSSQIDRFSPLPQEMIYNILSFLGMKDLRRCKEVSQLFYRIASDFRLWDVFYRGFVIPQEIIPQGMSKDEYFNRLALRSQDDQDDIVEKVKVFSKNMRTNYAKTIRFNLPYVGGFILIRLENRAMSLTAPVSREEYHYIKALPPYHGENVMNSTSYSVGSIHVDITTRYSKKSPEVEKIDQLTPRLKKAVNNGEIIRQQRRKKSSQQSTALICCLLGICVSFSLLSIFLKNLS